MQFWKCPPGYFCLIDPYHFQLVMAKDGEGRVRDMGYNLLNAEELKITDATEVQPLILKK